MHGRRTILVVSDASPTAANTELDGAAAYARRLGNWRYHAIPASAANLLSHMDRSRFDAVLGHLTDPAVLERIAEQRLPAVGMPAAVGVQAIPSVQHDHLAIGGMAADHLLSLGFRQCAYLGDAGPASLDRHAGFTARLAMLGVTSADPTHCTADGAFPTWFEMLKPSFLTRFLRSLELPCGLLAFNDEVGISIIDAAEELGIRVPQQLAVVGIDNNRIRCEFARVPLTSIDPDLYRVGYEAAALLDRIMRGQRAPAVPVLIPPKGLVLRQSTDIQAFDDPEFAEALRYLRDNALKGISIKQAMSHVPLSRIALERACRRYLGHSPAQEIRRLRIEHASRLLAETDLKAEEIGRRCGFVYLSHFSRLFQKQTGLSPKAYRARYQRLQTESPLASTT